MTTLADIEHSDDLPWGLHDAMLETVSIDWTKRQLVLTARVKMDERQTTERSIRLVLDGLVYFVAEPPNLFEPNTPNGLWIDANEGRPRNAPASLPPAPEGTFVHSIYCSDDNAFFYFCARDVKLTWLDDGEKPVQRGTGFHLPGEDIPDPIS